MHHTDDPAGEWRPGNDAVTNPDPQGGPALAVGMGHLHGRLIAAAAPDAGLRVETGSADWEVGRQPTGVTLRTEPTMLLELLAGRLTDPEVRALGWSDDPTPYLASIPVRILPPQDLMASTH